LQGIKFGVNGRTPSLQVKLVKVRIPVVDNTFIGYPSQDFFDSEIIRSNDWKLSAKAVDEDGNIAAVTGD
jgi:hypothetical protein